MHVHCKTCNIARFVQTLLQNYCKAINFHVFFLQNFANGDESAKLHRYVKAILPFLQKIWLNKAIYNCRFANLCPIFTIFGILVNNDIIGRSNDFGCHGNHFGGKICVTIITKMGIYIIKLTGAGWIQGVQHGVIHHWKVDTCSIPMVFEELWYCV